MWTPPDYQKMAVAVFDLIISYFNSSIKQQNNRIQPWWPFHLLPTAAIRHRSPSNMIIMTPVCVPCLCRFLIRDHTMPGAEKVSYCYFLAMRQLFLPLI